MQELNEKIYNKRTYSNSLSFLQDIIINIESYPELLKTGKSCDLLDYNEEIDYEKELKNINEEYEKNKENINNSNLKKIKAILKETEELLVVQKDKTDKLNINSRIDILNNKKLSKIYNEDRENIQKLINDNKEKLKKELKSLNTKLPLFADISISTKNYIITENLNNITTLKEILNQTNIETLISKLQLEDYYEDYYKQLDSKPLDIKYFDLFSFKKSQKNILREKYYPKLIIIKELNKFNHNNLQKEIEECIFNADVSIRLNQYDDLLLLLKNKPYTKTNKYIGKVKIKLEKALKEKDEYITQIIKNKISKIDFNKNNLSAEEKNILKLILEISKQEFKDLLNYDYKDKVYRELLTNKLEEYQEDKVDKYDISLSLNEVKTKINHKPQKKGKIKSLKLKIKEKFSK